MGDTQLNADLTGLVIETVDQPELCSLRATCRLSVSSMTLQKEQESLLRQANASIKIVSEWTNTEDEWSSIDHSSPIGKSLIGAN
jgi:hypothetical protein